VPGEGAQHGAGVEPAHRARGDSRPDRSRHYFSPVPAMPCTKYR
jgi:hypothetical protein